MNISKELLEMSEASLPGWNKFTVPSDDLGQADSKKPGLTLLHHRSPLAKPLGQQSYNVGYQLPRGDDRLANIETCAQYEFGSRHTPDRKDILSGPPGHSIAGMLLKYSLPTITTTDADAVLYNQAFSNLGSGNQVLGFSENLGDEVGIITPSALLSGFSAFPQQFLDMATLSSCFEQHMPSPLSFEGSDQSQRGKGINLLPRPGNALASNAAAQMFNAINIPGAF